MGVRVTVEIDRSTLAKLDALAADTNRPRALLMGEAVEGFVAHETAIIGKIEAGITDADRGEFTTDEELDEIERELAARDPYLASLEPLLFEWNSPEDAEAHDDL